MIRRRARDESAGRRIKYEHGPARDSIQPQIFKYDLAVIDYRLFQLAAAGASFSTNLEKIGKIITERQHQPEGLGGRAVIDDRKSLMRRALPKIGCADDMNRVARQNYPPILEDVGI